MIDRRLISLWEIMRTYNVGTLAALHSVFCELASQIHNLRENKGDAPVTDDFKEAYGKKFADAMAQVSELAFLPDFIHVIQTASKNISSDGVVNLGMIELELGHVVESILRGLSSCGFVAVPDSMKQYFEQEELFGESVHKVFPDARLDIKEAGNCLAVGLPTATVFYSMRVAEHGIRRLARRLKVKLLHKGSIHPIELAEWDKVITQIHSRIADIRKLPQGTKRQAKLEVYSDAADHCLFMKDVWRNPVSHTRKAYRESEALAAFERVRDFMKFLADAIL